LNEPIIVKSVGKEGL